MQHNDMTHVSIPHDVMKTRGVVTEGLYDDLHVVRRDEADHQKLGCSGRAIHVANTQTHVAKYTRVEMAQSILTFVGDVAPQDEHDALLELGGVGVVVEVNA